MHSITSLADKASLPRRTVQYWHDQGVIEPVNRDPLVYDDEGLILVRLLAGLTQLRPAIQAVKEIARILRLCLEEDESVPANVADAFRAARNGNEAYFGITPELLSNPGSNEDEDEDDFWPWTFGAVGESRLQRAVVECVKDRPHLGVTVVNLTYCFNLHRQHGIVHQ